MPASPQLSKAVARRRKRVQSLRQTLNSRGRPMSFCQIGQRLGISPQLVANDLKELGK
jgi:predicted ArsR family transcriptional regulator